MSEVAEFVVSSDDDVPAPIKSTSPTNADVSKQRKRRSRRPRSSRRGKSGGSAAARMLESLGSPQGRSRSSNPFFSGRNRRSRSRERSGAGVGAGAGAGAAAARRRRRRRRSGSDSDSSGRGSDPGPDAALVVDEGPTGYASSEDEAEQLSDVDDEDEFLDAVCVRPSRVLPSRVLPAPNGDPREQFNLVGTAWSAPLVVKSGLETKEAAASLPIRRDIDKEGIHVPPRPFVTKENWQRFQVRTAREQLHAHHTAGAPKPNEAATAGDLDRLPEETKTTAEDMPDHLAVGELLPHIGDPVERHHLRLDSGPDLHSYGTHAKNARLAVCIKRPLAGVASEADTLPKYRLDVVLHALKFMDHQLFCFEDWLVSGMEVLYREYSRRLRENKVSALGERLDALLFGARPESRVAREAWCTDILSTLSEQYTEDQNLKRLTHDIYEKWQEIKAQRVASAQKNTDVKLVARKLARDDGRRYGGAAGALGGVSPAHVRGASDVLDSVLAANPDYPMKHRGRVLLSRLTRGSPPLQTVLRVTHDDTYTGTPTPQEEARRQRVRALRVYCRLWVNGRQVGVSPTVPVGWPNYKAALKFPMQLQLVRRPKSIEVEIRRKGWLWDTTIARVMVPVPGLTSDVMAAPSFAPIDEWFHFSDTRPMRNPVLLPSTIQASKSGGSSSWATYQRFTLGSVRVGVAWGGDFGVGGQGMGMQLDKTAGTTLIPERAVELTGGRVLRVTNTHGMHGHEGDVFREQADTFDDPNDPRNRTSLSLTRASDLVEPDRKLFRIHALEKELQLAAAAQGGVASLAATNRHRLLQERSAHPENFKDPIPLEEQEIIWNPKWRSLLPTAKTSAEAAAAAAATAAEEDGEVGQAHSAAMAALKNFSLQAQKKAHGWTRKHHISLSDVVEEGRLYDFQNFGIGDVKKLVEPRRKLRPRQRQKQTLSGDAEGIKTCHFFVKVVRAINVPVRRADADLRSRAAYHHHHHTEEDDVGMVRTYVEVRFKDSVPMRTSSEEGSAPRWDQGIKIPFRPPHNDTSPKNLLTVHDSIHVSLFDERRRVVEDDIDGITKTILESTYLGSVDIPFTTVYLNGNVSGIFEVNVPPVNLGYKYQQAGTDEFSLPFAPVRVGPEAMNPAHAGARTFIYLLVSLDPPLPLPSEPVAPAPRGENMRLLIHARAWEARYKRSKAQALVMNSSGEWCLMNRYLRPQEPPPDAILFDLHHIPTAVDGAMMQKPLDTAEKVARFVALIPFLADWETFVGDTDLWCTSQEFVDLGYGDWEEHAVLLANYFMWLSEDKWETALVLGEGVPEGDTVYVMRRFTESNRIELWNAATGVVYSPEDVTCPLRKVSMITTSTNMYANVQTVNSPQELNWDTFNTRAWAPFFTRSFPMKNKTSVNPLKLVYKPPNREFAKTLQSTILRKLRDKLFDWRPDAPPDFNMVVKEKLDDMCVNLELMRLNEANPDQRRDHLELLNLKKVRITGFPINLPFTDLKSVFTAVKKTNIHKVQADANIQFGLSVRVIPYANMVASVWVYVCALVPE